MAKMKDIYEELASLNKVQDHINSIEDDDLKNALLYALNTNPILHFGSEQIPLFYELDFDEDSKEEIERLTKGADAFIIFSQHMSELKNELPQTPSQLILKMNYAYAVTLMETCLADMLKHAVLSQKIFMINALEKIKHFQSVKVDLIEIYKNPDYVSRFVMKVLTEYLYHNIALVLDIYRFTLNEDYPEFIMNNKGELIKIAEIRHDIVHRNGFDKEGNEHTFTLEGVRKAMQDIMDFVQGMHIYIAEAEKNLPF